MARLALALLFVLCAYTFAQQIEITELNEEIKFSTDLDSMGSRYTVLAECFGDRPMPSSWTTAWWVGYNDYGNAFWIRTSGMYPYWGTSCGTRSQHKAWPKEEDGYDKTREYTWFFTVDETGARYGIMDGTDLKFDNVYEESTKACPAKDRPFETEDICFGHACGYAGYTGCRNLRYFKGAKMTPGLEEGFQNGDVYYGPLCDGTEPDSEEGVFCSGCNWTGKKAVFTENQTCLEFYPKSIHIPKGKKMTIYNDCNFGGQDVTYYDDQECIGEDDDDDDNETEAFVSKGIKVHQKEKKNLKKNTKAQKNLPENMKFKLEDKE